MRRFTIIAALALVVGTASAVAVAENGNGGDPAANENNFPAQCADQDKSEGAFGKCVSEKASAFGKCVAEAAKSRSGNPTESCADLKPGRQNGDEDANGEDTGDANDNNASDKNPTTGLTRPPEQSGREFGQQVSENARQLGSGNGANAQAHNPTIGQTLPPTQSGREFGQQVSENARGNSPGGP
jgi:hypothetical protein